MTYLRVYQKLNLKRTFVRLLFVLRSPNIVTFKCKFSAWIWEYVKYVSSVQIWRINNIRIAINSFLKDRQTMTSTLLNLSYRIGLKRRTRQESSMIYSASPQSRPTVLVARFWSFGTDRRSDVRTNCVKIVITTGQDCFRPRGSTWCCFSLFSLMW